MKLPAPNSPPQPLETLYLQHAQPEYPVPAERIRRALHQQPRERLRVVSLRMKGYSWGQIGRALKLSRIDAQCALKRTMLDARKEIEHLPRYWKIGHPSVAPHERPNGRKPRVWKNRVTSPAPSPATQPEEPAA